MAEAPKAATAEAQEGAPRVEASAEVSLDAKRNELVGLADGHSDGIQKILEALAGSDLEAEAEKIRAEASVKVEELKALLAKLLAEKAEKKEENKKIGAAQSWEELGAAIGPEGLVGSDGKVYSQATLVKAVEAFKELSAKGLKIAANSPIINALTRTAGFRNKVVELLGKGTGSVETAGAVEAPVEAGKEAAGELAVGDKVKWTNAKGVEMEGEVAEVLAGLTEDGKSKVRVITAKNRSGFAITVDKLTKVEASPAEGQEEEPTMSIEERAEKIKNLESFLKQAEVALEYIDGGKATTAMGHKLITEALVLAGNLLGKTGEVETLMQNKRTGTEDYRKALEAFFKEALENSKQLGQEQAEAEQAATDTETQPVGPVAPPVGPDVPPVGPDVPPVGPDVPPVGPDVPPVGPDVPPVGPDVPPVGPDVPPVGPDVPPVGPDIPPVGPDKPPVPGQEGGEKGARLQELKSDYANKEAIARKSWGGIGGVMRRLLNPKGYQEALKNRQEALDAYQAERAEQVLGSVDKMCDEQISLASEMAARMAEKKKIPILSDIYAGYKKLGNVTFFEGKVGKILNARMLISMGLLGAGLVLGGPAAPAGFLIGRRIIGGAMAAFGKYDALTKGAEVFEPQVKLSPENQRAMDAYKKEKGLGAFSRGINKFILGGGDKDKQYKQKYLELAVSQKNEMSDEDLEKSITYFEANNVFFGKNPTENESYMALMSEKRNRMKAVLAEVDSGIDVEGSEAKKKYDEMVDAKKKEMMQPKVDEVVDYVKQWYVVEAKLFEDMKNVAVPAGTKEEQQAARKATPEYSAWAEGIEKMRGMLSGLPEEVQVILQTAEGDQMGRRTGMKALLDLSTADQLYKEKYDQIDTADVAAAEWHLNAGVEAKIRDLISKDPEFIKEAEEAARREAGEFIQTMDDLERKRERRKDAVWAFLNEDMKKHDDAVDERIKVAVRRDAYRKLAAGALGLFIAGGGIGAIIKHFAHGEVPVDQKGGGGGPVPSDPEIPGGGTKPPMPIPEQGGGGGESIPDGEPLPEDGQSIWNPDGEPFPEDGQSIWDPNTPPADDGTLDYCGPDVPTPEPVLPGPEIALAEGVFGKGDGVIHVARKLAEANPKLFEGMSDSEMQKWVLDKLTHTNLPSGKAAMEYVQGVGWKYNFMPHPGGEVHFLTDAQGHATGIDLQFGDKVRMLANGVLKPFATPAVLDQAMNQNVDQMNAMAAQIREAKGAVGPLPDMPAMPEAIGEVRVGTLAEKIAFEAQQRDFIAQQQEYLADIKSSANSVVETAGAPAEAPLDVQPDDVPAPEVSTTETPVSGDNLTDTTEAGPSGDNIEDVSEGNVEGNVEATTEAVPGGTVERVMSEGTVTGMDQQALISRGILEPDFYEKIAEKGGNLNLSRQSVMMTARSLAVQQQSLDRAIELGDTAKADAIKRAMKAVVGMTNRRYGGGVFKEIE